MAMANNINWYNTILIRMQVCKLSPDVGVQIQEGAEIHGAHVIS